jgi:hypothetical protein
MDEEHPESLPLEQQLAAWERGAGELERQVKRLVAAARTLSRVAREGDLAGSGAAVAALRQSHGQVGAALDEVAKTPDYDVAEAFAGGKYLRELAEATKQAGVTLVVRDGIISSFPVSLRLDAGRGAVRVGPRLEKRLRPSFLADQLRRLQQAPNRFNARAFATQIFRAYALLARAAQPGWKAVTPGAGPVVPLAEIFEVLTLSPGSEYRPEEFAADLLRLDRAPDTQTSSGHRVHFAASTGLKGAKRLTVFDEDGRSHEYFAIRFALEPGDGRSENASFAA